MIGQSLPNITLTMVTLVSVFCVMIYYSVWMAIIIVAGVLFMAYMTKVLGSRSARNFVAQQKEIGIVEGHVEEIMNGQRVVKVSATSRRRRRTSTCATRNSSARAAPPTCTPTRSAPSS